MDFKSTSKENRRRGRRSKEKHTVNKHAKLISGGGIFLFAVSGCQGAAALQGRGAVHPGQGQACRVVASEHT